MAAIKKQLAQLTLNSGEVFTVYETPNNHTTILKEMTICNPTDKAVYFTMGIKPINDLIALDNAIFYTAYLPAGQTNIITMSSIVPDGESIYVTCDPVTTGGSLNIIISGVELVNSSAVRLVREIISTTVNTPLYTVPTNTTSVLYQAMFTNGSDASVNVSMYVVPEADGTASDTNVVLANIPVAVGETLIYTAATAMPAGTAIFANSSSANSINLTIDGTEK